MGPGPHRARGAVPGPAGGVLRGTCGASVPSQDKREALQEALEGERQTLQSSDSGLHPVSSWPHRAPVLELQPLLRAVQLACSLQLPDWFPQASSEEVGG